MQRAHGQARRRAAAVQSLVVSSCHVMAMRVGSLRRIDLGAEAG
jgi:hypothetical protein